MHKFTSKIRLALVLASMPVLVAIPAKVGLSQYPPFPPFPPFAPFPPPVPPLVQPPVVPPTFTAARALISGQGVTGAVSMVQTPFFVAIDVYVQGDPKILTPGLHGLHLHEKGSCQANEQPAFKSAGEHLDLGPNRNSTVANHPYHTGDLGNIQVNPNGVGVLKTVSTRFNLPPGALSIFDNDGTSIVVKKLPDQVKAGGTEAEAGGEGIACGVIQAIPNPK